MGTRGLAALSAVAILTMLTLAGGSQAAPEPDCNPAGTNCVHFPIDRLIENGCNGEPVHVVGTAHVATRVGASPSGGVLVTVYESFQRTNGVGTITGAVYNVDEQVHSFFDFPPILQPFDVVIVDHHNVISTRPAQAPNWILRSETRITFDPPNDPVVQPLELKSKCTG
jgi:hypothetical protein